MKTCLKAGLPDGFYSGSAIHYWVSLGKLLMSVSWYIKQGPRWTTCSSLTGTYLVFSSIQSLSCPTLCNPMDCSTPGFPVHHQLPGLAQTHVHWSRWHHPCLLLPSIFSSIRVFSNESVLRIRCPKYWGFSLSISPSNEYSGLISFRIDCLDLLEVQGTLKSLLQNHSWKASILWCSAFLIVQLSRPFMITGKTIAWTGWNFGSKVLFLLFNMLSRLVTNLFQRASIFWFHGCSHHLQWCWSLRK